MKAIPTATILVAVAWMWSAAQAQDDTAPPSNETTSNGQPEIAASTTDVTPGNITDNQSNPSLAQSPETEAEREARLQIMVKLQTQVDNCNQNFMGLPKEHEQCVQKVLDQITMENQGGKNNLEDNEKDE